MVGSGDGVDMVSVPRDFLGTGLSKVLRRLVQRDVCLVVQGTPGVQDLVCGDVNFIPLAVEHILARLSTDLGQIILGNVVGGHQEGVPGSDVALMEVDVGLPWLAIGGEEVILKLDGIDLLVGIVEDMNGAVAKAEIGHITTPEGNDILTPQLLRPEVGGHLVRALVHEIAIVVVDEGGRAGILIPPGTNEDKARINLARLGDVQARRSPRASHKGGEGPCVLGDSLQGQQQERAAGQKGPSHHSASTSKTRTKQIRRRERL